MAFQERSEDKGHENRKWKWPYPIRSEENGKWKWPFPVLRMSATLTYTTPHHSNRKVNELLFASCGGSLCLSPLSFVPFLFDRVSESDKFKGEFWSLWAK